MINLANPLISTAEYAAIEGRADVKPVDASWWLDGRNAHEDFESERLTGAVFFDMEAISDQASPLPHMLPSPEAFAAAVGALGISETDLIVVYDTQGLFSAARVWWMFRLFGADRAVVLDGGLPKWKSEGRSTQSGASSSVREATFKPTAHPEAVADLSDIQSALGRDTQIVDARGVPRFNGTSPEPRAGMRSGHMPGAFNLPYTHLLNADKTIKGGPELEAAFKEIGLDLDKPVITSCGSGVTAAILTLGLALTGKSSRLYDGSWAEWGSRKDTPIVTAP